MNRPAQHVIGDPMPILVIDDSAVARQALRSIIEKEPGFHVLVAGDPYEAVEVMRKRAPSAIVLDVNMPRMDGLTFLRKLMRQHPLPVLLCTDEPQRGLAGLELGAIEVIPKPRWEDAAERSAWGERLRDSLRQAVTAGATGALESAVAEETAASRAGVEPRYNADVILPRGPFQPRSAPNERVIALGASTGGVQTLARLLADLPGDLPGLVIVQHMPGGFTAAFADRLGRDVKIRTHVSEGRHGQPLRPGTAVVVPGGLHGLVRRSGPGYRLELSEGPPVSRHRPSVDVLFRSVAQAAGPRGLAVLLTGMGDDGAEGLLEIREAGGWTIAQDKASCVVFGMPGEAIRRGAVREVLALDRIAGGITSWCGVHT